MVTRRNFNHLILAGVVATHLPNVAPAFASTESGAGETGPLDAHTLSVLMATAEAVTGIPSLQGYYESYYDHQAVHRAGYLLLYRQYADRVDRAAKRSGGANFLACDVPTRIAIIERVRSMLGGAPQFEIPIFQETLAVYQKTDAWLQLGYLSWPGSPRGQDFYKEPF